MEKMNFPVVIDAPKERVWKVLWDDASYRNWTSAFTEGSHVVTDNWKEGSKVLFLDAEGRGMVSKVATNKPNEYMSFKHIGEIIDGKEDTESEKVRSWSGAMENYTLTEENGKTKLVVDMDITADFKDYFLKTWPVALERIKELAEKN